MANGYGNSGGNDSFGNNNSGGGDSFGNNNSKGQAKEETQYKPPKGTTSETAEQALARMLGETEGTGGEFDSTSAPTRITLNPFEKMINETFPDPEIVRIDFSMPDDFSAIDEIKIQVKVTGNFLDDEWFWADFLQFFKIKTYLLPDVNNNKNKDFWNISMFDASKLGHNDRIWFAAPPPNQYYEIGIPQLRNATYDMTKASAKLRDGQQMDSDDMNADVIRAAIRDGRYVKPKRVYDTNTYYFTSNLTIHDSYKQSLIGRKSVIVARTYFDIGEFIKEKLPGVGGSPLDPLKWSNNGKWDMVEFGTDDKVNLNWVKRFYHSFTGIHNATKWDGPFDREVGGYLVATSDATAPENAAVSVLVSGREDFGSTNKASLSVAKGIYDQAKIDTANQAAIDAQNARDTACANLLTEFENMTKAEKIAAYKGVPWDQFMEGRFEKQCGTDKAKRTPFENEYNRATTSKSPAQTKPPPPIKSPAATAPPPAPAKLAPVEPRPIISNLGDAFSNPYIGIGSNGKANLTFSFDYLQLAEGILSLIPDGFWNEVEKVATEGVIRTINVEDPSFLETGYYRYDVIVSFNSHIKEEVDNIVTKLAGAKSKVVEFYNEANKSENSDSNTGEIWLNTALINSLASTYQNEGVRVFLDLLAYNPLNFFTIKELTVKRTRVISDTNHTEFDLNEVPTTILSLEEDQYTEQLLQTMTTNENYTDLTPEASYFLDFFTENESWFSLDEAFSPYMMTLNLTDLESLKLLMQNLQTKYENILTKITESQSVNGQPAPPGNTPVARHKINLNGIYDAEDKKTAMKTEEKIPSLQIPASDNVTIEILDETGTEIASRVQGEIQYLKRYEKNTNSKILMKSPEFISVTDLKDNSGVLRPEMNGATVLCKIQPQQSISYPIYNEYFIKTIFAGEEEG